MRKTRWLLAMSITLGATAGASAGPAAGPTSALASVGPGLSVSSQPWARWQARLVFGAASPAWQSALSPALGSALATSDRSELRPARLSLLGDYYLSVPASGSARASGLRATGGILLGPRARPWIGQALATGNPPLSHSSSLGTALMPSLPSARESLGDSAALPYLGVGYMAAPGRSGWSLGADLGLVAQRPGSAGYALGRGKSLDDAVRELRLTPLFQVGISYSF